MIHALDYGIVAAYLLVVLWLGRRAAGGVHDQESFFLAGRRFGKLLQFFFNFGNTTEAHTAVSTVSFVYRDGASGSWLPLQMLFLNPYYWFMNVWFRRVRLMTMAEVFEARLGSRSLAVFYSLFQIGVAVMGIGFSNFVSYKIVSAIVPGLNALLFYAAYVAVIALYLAMGGLMATALNQIFQGVLVLAFSVMLLPYGWRALGGASLRSRLPQHSFDLFARGAGHPYTWYAVLALLTASIVQINANVVNMGLGGSARDEYAARFGAVSGTFGKRLMVVLWAMLGLVAAALCQGRDALADPDQAWGILSLRLLGPGLLGLMLAGVLASNMPSTASKTMAMSALFVRNLRRYVTASRGEEGGVFAGRVAVFVALAGSVVAALFMRQALTVTKLIITINLPFGAAMLLMFFWRRVTAPAVWWCVIVSSLVIFVIPFAVQTAPWMGAGRSAPGFFESAGAQGRFNLEAWLLDCAGAPLAGAGPAPLLAVQFFFDAAFPFVVLFAASLLTRPPPPAMVDRFFGIMKTPVGATPELDAAAVADTAMNPGRFDHTKLFPRSAWEFTRWDRTDTIGFLVCCAISGAILGGFYLVLESLR